MWKPSASGERRSKAVKKESGPDFIILDGINAGVERTRPLMQSTAARLCSCSNE